MSSPRRSAAWGPWGRRRWAGISHFPPWSLLWLACLLASLTGSRPALAELTSLVQAEMALAGQQRTRVTLPHFVRQDHSGLMQVHWTLRLPSTVPAQRLPALLLPQPVQGLTVSMKGQIIYELPRSTPDTLHHWYRPVLVPLPQALMDEEGPVRIDFEQTGHLRGWYVAPVLQGELMELQPWHDRYLLLSNTLPTTINLLSMLVGLFVLALGWHTRSSTYVFGGMTMLVWGVLFTLALWPELPRPTWPLWRLMLYACTGNLIYAVLRFLAALFRYSLSGWVHRPLWVFLQGGWVVFACWGTRAEPLLDVIWTALAVALYGAGSLFLVTLGLRQREYRKVLLFGLHGALTAALAWHDYTLQAGEWSAPGWVAGSEDWYALLLQPVYLTHLSLPVFVVMALWLMVQDHLRHQQEHLEHEQALHAQRDRITRDIHDGVGARLNLMLWRTRTTPLQASQLQDELERSIEELRFAINPPQAADHTLNESLRTLCERSARWGHPLGIEVRFIPDPVSGGLSSEQGLHLYKAAHEALGNALRHSQATRIEVHLTRSTTAIVLIVQDNGRGIPGWKSDDAHLPGIRATAMGLRGMRQRLQALGGDCLIESSARGTRVVLSLPGKFINA